MCLGPSSIRIHSCWKWNGVFYQCNGELPPFFSVARIPCALASLSSTRIVLHCGERAHTHTHSATLSLLRCRNVRWSRLLDVPTHKTANRSFCVVLEDFASFHFISLLLWRSKRGTHEAVDALIHLPFQLSGIHSFFHRIVFYYYYSELLATRCLHSSCQSHTRIRLPVPFQEKYASLRDRGPLDQCETVCSQVIIGNR